jgi:hypothetical protein
MDLRWMIGSSGPRLLRLPEQGQLLICTDLHGNLRDFRRMRELFCQRLDGGESPFLLFTGDLIHGPSCTAEEWPDYLGSFFPDESPRVVEEFIQLQERYPDKVACLLGNHEHSHVGGPHTPKFWPDETLHFEQSVGPKLAKRCRRLFRSFPAVALARCGVVVTHAAPNAEIKGPSDIEAMRYEGFEELPITSLEEMPLLGRLLWSRRCPPPVAKRFLEALSVGGLTLGVVVYGHEIVPEGFERIGEEQLLLSTSFGVRDENKTYLLLDLGGHYGSSAVLREGVELLPLWAG